MEYSNTIFVTEIFKSIQGEGKTLGKPSLFIRLGSCNLNCEWCDSKKASENRVIMLKIKNNKDMEDFIKYLKYHISSTNIKNIVITGGEPTIYDKCGFLPDLVYYFLKEKNNIEIETNGTIFPKETLKMVKDNNYKILFNISPKFFQMDNEIRENFDKSISYYLLEYEAIDNDSIDITFKFPFKGLTIEKETILYFINKFSIPKNICYIMPICINREQYLRNSLCAVSFCMKEGLNFSPREQIVLWDDSVLV